MDGQDFEFEEFQVSEAISLSFHGFDLVVGAFQGAAGDRVVIIGQNAAAVEGQGQGLHGPNYYLPSRTDLEVRMWVDGHSEVTISMLEIQTIPTSELESAENQIPAEMYGDLAKG